MINDFYQKLVIILIFGTFSSVLRVEFMFSNFRDVMN